MPSDPGAIRAYAEAAESFGFRHILAYDHVLGADRSVHEGWWAPYDHTTTFREPFVLFGYLAGVCSMELATGIVVLPQRQTALVAKQAADVDLLTGGRLRLGVGPGWNWVEYEALGMPFEDRAVRLEEQIHVLRRLWTEPVVTFVGARHRVTAAGIAPLPQQRPIPIWMGARHDSALRRAGRLADGWIPLVGPGPDLARGLDILRGAASEAGRDPAALGLEGRIDLISGTEEAAAAAEDWRSFGATHLSVDTMNAGLNGVDKHIWALQEVAGALGLSEAAYRL